MVPELNGGGTVAQADAAIVTGGAGGIGKATVRRLLDRGMSVFIIDADERSLDAVLGELGSASGRLDGCVANVLDEQQVIQSVNRAVQRFGGVLRARSCRGRRRSQTRARHRGFPAQ